MKIEALPNRYSALESDQSSSDVRSTDIWLEQNHTLGLWVAYVRREGTAPTVIMDSDRDDLIAAAQALEDEPELRLAA